ncbi:hypothetical protein [Abyssisolibacter fermentans]|uniref:hypothetical protein n=1 Tax=Abyssisolibacter fermentans TaxID=1766203 RepID=UPI00083734F3|nr:hypothetical protein [Abyssisolibacter fermentans]
MGKKVFQNEIDVLKYQREKINSLDNSYSQMNNELDELEKRVQEFINNQNTDKSVITEFIENNRIEKLEWQKVKKRPQKRFEDLINESHDSGYSNVAINEVATKKEINEANYLLSKYNSEFTDQYKLDKYDYAISGIIGTIAALIDYFLVTKTVGKKVVPGKLKSGVETFWNKLLSGEKIKELEEKYKVTYDISSNTSKISQEVLGLCPLYHRFQSLGHDPILGFIFGIADLMKGQLTAIDGNGRLIVQSVQGAETKSFIESIITVFGHFLSDVGTKSKTGKILSVPAPLTPLLQLIQVGSIEYNGNKYTVADLSKKMYYDGYNFNHFIGMSVPVLLIEILMRLSFVIKEMFFSKRDVSLRGNPKLTIMLCIANGILFAENAGKFVITKNPFSINYVSWISTVKYGFKTLKWLVHDREIGKIEHAQEYIDTNWKYLSLSANELDRDASVYYID